MNNMDSDDEKMTFHDASDKALEVVEKDPLGCTFDETLQPVLDFTSLAENRPPKQVNGKKTDVKKFKSDLYAASNAMKMSEVVHNLMQLTTKEFLMNSVELEDDKNSDWNVTVNEVNKIVTHNQKAPKSTSTEAAQLVAAAVSTLEEAAAAYEVEIHNRKKGLSYLKNARSIVEKYIEKHSDGRTAKKK